MTVSPFLRSVTAVAFGVLFVLFGVSSAPENRSLASQATPTPGSTCEISPVNPDRFVTILAASPATQGASLTGAFRDSAPAVDPGNIAAVQSVLVSLVACANAGDFARVAAHFTDDYWRREIGEFSARAQALGEMAQASPTPVPADLRQQPSKILDAGMLPDGRLAALVDFGAATPTDRNIDLVAFAREDGEWLIDEVATNVESVVATPATE